MGFLELRVNLQSGHIDSSADFLNIVAWVLVLLAQIVKRKWKRKRAIVAARRGSRNFWPGDRIPVAAVAARQGSLKT